MGAKELLGSVLDLLNRQKKKPDKEILDPDHVIFFSRQGTVYIFDTSKIKFQPNTDIYLQDPGMNWVLRCRLLDGPPSRFSILNPPTEVVFQEIPEEAYIYTVRAADEAETLAYRQRIEERKEHLRTPFRHY